VEREGNLSPLHFPKASFAENAPTKQILFFVFNGRERSGLDAMDGGT
jgi:hypothetical protein